MKEGIVKSIAEAIVGAQAKVSRTLSRWERKCSLLQRKAMFFLLMAMAGGYCTYMLGNALFRQDKRPLPNTVTGWEMHQPLQIPYPNDRNIQSGDTAINQVSTHKKR